MTKMSRKKLRDYFDRLGDAFDNLSKIKNATIKDVYEEHSEDFLTLCSTFELTEWEYITVGTFMKEMGEGDIDLGEDEDV